MKNSDQSGELELTTESEEGAGGSRQSQRTATPAEIAETIDPEATKTDVAFPLTGLGEASLGMGRPAAAIEPLERALAIRLTRAGEANELGETRFALARALWDANRERKRALTLARQARVDYARGDQAKQAEIAEWLAQHSQ